MTYPTSASKMSFLSKFDFEHVTFVYLSKQLRIFFPRSYPPVGNVLFFILNVEKKKEEAKSILPSFP